MHLENIEYSETGNVAYITINRPGKLNALSRNMWKGLQAALKKADANDDIYAIIMSGKGRAFCAGDDISELLATKDWSIAKDLFIDCIYGLVETIAYLKKPLVAQVNGLAYGGGCELVMLSDIAVASAQSTFALPEASIGAWPPIFCVFGPFLVGFKAAHEMTLTNAPINAETALKIGLVSRVVEEDKLSDTTLKIVENILKSSPASIKIIKETTNKIIGDRIYEFHIACQRFLREVSQTKDYIEGARAFLEKKKPHFIGR